MGLPVSYSLSPLKNKRKTISLVVTVKFYQFQFLNRLRKMDNNQITQHISGNFNKELEDIRNKVLEMGGLVEEQIEQAVRALSNSDMELAELVIKQECAIDNLEMIIDAECTKIIALRQPTASDLRLLLTVLSIINELERIGDLAERIAKMAVYLSNSNDGKRYQYYEVQHMAGLAKGMLIT
jgi:phosphate transport system protein